MLIDYWYEICKLIKAARIGFASSFVRDFELLTKSHLTLVVKSTINYECRT